MKWGITIGLIMMASTAFSQNARVDFTRIDREVLAIAPASPAVLARELTASCSGDLEKVRAIFRWITENIEYQMKMPPIRRFASYQPEKDTGILKPLDERVAELVLEKGTAVCDGYARLFKTLCTYAGLRSELITGYARTESYKKSQQFRSNHTWNAVFIEGDWKLLDVTWASGYVTRWGHSFVRYFDEEYFLTDPIDFIREHYPDDIRWTLLGDPPVMEEFRDSPFKQRTFIKYKISALRPAKGQIEASLGDYIEIEIETADAEADKRIGADPFLDRSIYTSPVSELLQPFTVKGNKTIYTYHVVSPSIKWLYILYNNDVVLRYSLQFKE